MNDSRSIESCRTASVCPGPPNTISWCATRPGSRIEWIGSCTFAPASRSSAAVRKVGSLEQRLTLGLENLL